MSAGGGRLMSLDVLRGFDMIWIMGLSRVVCEFCGLFEGGTSGWLYGQMHHAEGVGLTFFDLIFPLFLFMAGVSWPFSYASQVRRGVPSSTVHLRILKRVLVLAVIQMLQSGMLCFDPDKYFYPSVLIRIALSWAIAALIYIHFPKKVGIAIAVIGVAAYWALLAFVPSPLQPAGQPFDYADWQHSHAIWADRWISLRAWIGHDPFERMDVPLAIVQVPLALLGMFAGDLVRKESWPMAKRAGALGCLGVALAGTGIALVAFGCPFSKQLSTASFMLFVGGICCLLLALFYYVIDVRGYVRWTYPLRVVGMNSIVAYLLPSLVLFFPATPLVGAIGKLLLCWLVIWALARANLFLRA